MTPRRSTEPTEGPESPSERDEREWRDPANWYGGWLGLYHAPRDSRTIVPKRRPWMGWTVNAARPGGRLLLGGALVLLVGALVMAALDAR